MIAPPAAAKRAHHGERRALRELAQRAGIQTAYVDAAGVRRVASIEVLTAALGALGSPVERPADARDIVRALDRERAARGAPPVVVAWDGRLREIRLLAPPPRGAEHIRAHVVIDDGGDEREVQLEIGSLVSRRGGCAVRVRCPEAIPAGLHDLILDPGGGAQRSRLIAAPRQCFGSERHRRDLGLFLPLHALRSRASWGVGDVTDLRRFAEWAGTCGVQLIGILPVLASFLDEPFDPSPYAPVSRLFWNEMHADVAAAPEFEHAEAARRLLASDELSRAREVLNRGKLVDHRAAMALKRQVLTTLADAAFAEDRSRNEIERALREHPLLGAYAGFRAAVERHGGPWSSWPARERDGALPDRDTEGSAWRRHVYAQWLMERQLGACARDLASRDVDLYLDLPIGVHPGGFDTWCFREQFAAGAAIGAPPDALFSGGQNWASPPLHPRRSAEAGHAYFASVIEHHMRHAGALRIDHVMGLHRRFWIPDGFDARDGVYVRYPADELYAIISLLSHRHRTRVAGENLGTVPREVTHTLERRGILGMWVGQFSLGGSPDPLPEPGEATLASLNTHDTPTFAGFWSGADIDRLVDLEMLDPTDAEREREGRASMRGRIIDALHARGLLGAPDPGPGDVLEALLAVLAGSEAELIVVTLEDLWLEGEPQNMPGITAERHPSWRRRAARSLEELCADGRLCDLLRRLDLARREARAGGTMTAIDDEGDASS